jgi:hypothetical protein
MSHITKVKTQLKDGVILRKALEKLGYRVGDGDRESDLAGRGFPRNLELIAKKDRLWIGFKRAGKCDEPYEMLADLDGYMKNRERIVSEIHQIYSREKILDLARAKGYAITRNQVNEKGQIEMVLRKFGGIE